MRNSFEVSAKKAENHCARANNSRATKNKANTIEHTGSLQSRHLSPWKLIIATSNENDLQQTVISASYFWNLFSSNQFSFALLINHSNIFAQIFSLQRLAIDRTRLLKLWVATPNWVAKQIGFLCLVPQNV